MIKNFKYKNYFFIIATLLIILFNINIRLTSVSSDISDSTGEYSYSYYKYWSMLKFGINHAKIFMYRTSCSECSQNSVLILQNNCIKQVGNCTCSITENTKHLMEQKQLHYEHEISERQQDKEYRKAQRKKDKEYRKAQQTMCRFNSCIPYSNQLCRILYIIISMTILYFIFNKFSK